MEEPEASELEDGEIAEENEENVRHEERSGSGSAEEGEYIHNSRRYRSRHKDSSRSIHQKDRSRTTLSRKISRDDRSRRRVPSNNRSREDDSRSYSRSKSQQSREELYSSIKPARPFRHSRGNSQNRRVSSDSSHTTSSNSPHSGRRHSDGCQFRRRHRTGESQSRNFHRRQSHTEHRPTDGEDEIVDVEYRKEDLCDQEGEKTLVEGLKVKVIPIPTATPPSSAPVPAKLSARKNTLDDIVSEEDDASIVSVEIVENDVARIQIITIDTTDTSDEEGGASAAKAQSSVQASSSKANTSQQASGVAQRTSASTNHDTPNSKLLAVGPTVKSSSPHNFSSLISDDLEAISTDTGPESTVEEVSAEASFETSSSATTIQAVSAKNDHVPDGTPVDRQRQRTTDGGDDMSDEEIEVLELRTKLLEEMLKQHQTVAKSRTPSGERVVVEDFNHKTTRITIQNIREEDEGSHSEATPEEEEALREILLAQLLRSKKEKDENQQVEMTDSSISPIHDDINSGSRFLATSSSCDSLASASRKKLMKHTGPLSSSPVVRGMKRKTLHDDSYSPASPPPDEQAPQDAHHTRVVKVTNEPLFINTSNHLLHIQRPQLPKLRNLPKNDLRKKLLRNASLRKSLNELETLTKHNSAPASPQPVDQLFPEFGVVDTDWRQAQEAPSRQQGELPTDITIRRTVNFDSSSSSGSTSVTWAEPISVSVADQSPNFQLHPGPISPSQHSLLPLAPISPSLHHNPINSGGNLLISPQQLPHDYDPMRPNIMPFGGSQEIPSTLSLGSPHTVSIYANAGNGPISPILQSVTTRPRMTVPGYFPNSPLGIPAPPQDGIYARLLAISKSSPPIAGVGYGLDPFERSPLTPVPYTSPQGIASDATMNMNMSPGDIFSSFSQSTIRPESILSEISKAASGTIMKTSTVSSRASSSNVPMEAISVSKVATFLNTATVTVSAGTKAPFTSKLGQSLDSNKDAPHTTLKISPTLRSTVMSKPPLEPNVFVGKSSIPPKEDTVITAPQPTKTGDAVTTLPSKSVGTSKNKSHNTPNPGATSNRTDVVEKSNQVGGMSTTLKQVTTAAPVPKATAGSAKPLLSKSQNSRQSITPTSSKPAMTPKPKCGGRQRPQWESNMVLRSSKLAVLPPLNHGANPPSTATTDAVAAITLPSKALDTESSTTSTPVTSSNPSVKPTSGESNPVMGKSSASPNQDPVVKPSSTEDSNPPTKRLKTSAAPLNPDPVVKTPTKPLDTTKEVAPASSKLIATSGSADVSKQPGESNPIVEKQKSIPPNQDAAGKTSKRPAEGSTALSSKVAKSVDSAKGTSTTTPVSTEPKINKTVQPPASLTLELNSPLKELKASTAPSNPDVVIKSSPKESAKASETVPSNPLEAAPKISPKQVAGPATTSKQPPILAKSLDFAKDISPTPKPVSIADPAGASGPAEITKSVLPSAAATNEVNITSSPLEPKTGPPSSTKKDSMPLTELEKLEGNSNLATPAEGATIPKAACNFNAQAGLTETAPITNSNLSLDSISEAPETPVKNSSDTLSTLKGKIVNRRITKGTVGGRGRRRSISAQPAARPHADSGLNGTINPISKLAAVTAGKSIGQRSLPSSPYTPRPISKIIIPVRDDDSTTDEDSDEKERPPMDIDFQKSLESFLRRTREEADRKKAENAEAATLNTSTSAAPLAISSKSSFPLSTAESTESNNKTDKAPSQFVQGTSNSAVAGESGQKSVAPKVTSTASTSLATGAPKVARKNVLIPKVAVATVPSNFPTVRESLALRASSKAMIDDLTKKIIESRDQLALSSKEKELLQQRQKLYSDYREIQRKLQQNMRLVNLDKNLENQIADLQKKLTEAKSRQQAARSKATEINASIKEKSRLLLTTKIQCSVLSRDVKTLGDKVIGENVYKVTDLFSKDIMDVIKTLELLSGKQTKAVQLERGAIFQQILGDLEIPQSLLPQASGSAKTTSEESAGVREFLTSSVTGTRSRSSSGDRTPAAKSSEADNVATTSSGADLCKNCKCAIERDDDEDAKAPNKHNWVQKGCLTKHSTEPTEKDMVLEEELDAKSKLSFEEKIYQSVLRDPNPNRLNLHESLPLKLGLRNGIGNSISLDPMKTLCLDSVVNGKCAQDDCPHQHI